MQEGKALFGFGFDPIGVGLGPFYDFVGDTASRDLSQWRLIQGLQQARHAAYLLEPTPREMHESCFVLEPIEALLERWPHPLWEDLVEVLWRMIVVGHARLVNAIALTPVGAALSTTDQDCAPWRS